jgi:hypothetical protein
LEIHAYDAGNNATTNFNSSLTLKFNAESATGNVSNSTNNTVTLGSDTAINFVSGVSTVQAGGSNGRMVLNGSNTVFVTASGSGVSTPPANALGIDFSTNITGADDPDAPGPQHDKLFLPLVPKEDPARAGDIAPSQIDPRGVYLPSVHN